MKRRPKDYLVEAADDGLVAAQVGPWGTEKYRRLGMYAEMFSTGMKNTWPTRVYLDLFSGPGHAMLGNPPHRVLTSPLLALTVPDPFAKYIFCDKNSANIDALRRRASRMAPETPVAYVVGDVNALVDEIGALIPPHSSTNKVLNFCFVDPFKLNIDFATIRNLGADRAMDFLILLALGTDANRNWATYLLPENKRIESFLGDPDWRSRWAEAHADGISPIRFLASAYARAMAGLGYKTTSLDQMVRVKTYGNNMLLYYLAFFSKNQKGYDFWGEVQKYSTDQLGLSF
ncbi:MAG: three-Cys-motif partner protein TcmP [Gemmatimonadales bacterium]